MRQSLRRPKTAFLLWLPSVFGVAGLHRFYMGKKWTGLLWFFTAGLGYIGTIYDAVTMMKQLREADFQDGLNPPDERAYWKELADSMGERSARRIRDRRGLNDYEQPEAPRQNLEQSAFRIAKANRGFTSPAQLSLETGVGADEAKGFLDSLVVKGYADIRIRKNGLVAYVFPDFLADDVAKEFESF